MNYDTLSISWQNAAANDPTASINSASIPPKSMTSWTFFGIRNTEAKKTQQFTAFHPNYCFYLQENIIKITSEQKFPSVKAMTPELIRNMFKFENGETASAIIKQNEVLIHFRTTSANYPLYVYCQIVCFEDSFSSSIENEIQSDHVKHLFYYSADKEYFFTFSNLMRNHRYKIKCEVATSQIDKSKQEKQSIEFLTMSSKLSSKQLEITYYEKYLLLNV